MGYSIGSAAALHLSSCRDITGLLLIAPMYDGTSLYLPRESILHALLEKTATVQMQNDEFAPLCSVPVLIIASHTDRMTREEDISALSDLFSDPPSMVFLDIRSFPRTFSLFPELLPKSVRYQWSVAPLHGKPT